MELFKLDKFTKGWVVGNFTPSIFRTKEFEISVRKYDAGTIDETHLHKVAPEITIIISGKYNFNDKIIGEGDIALIKPGDISRFECIESGWNVVIKTPSVKGDKYIISN